MASETEPGAVTPALTPDQWRDYGDPDFLRSAIPQACDAVSHDIDRSPAALVALANAARADSDPGKLTWADVDLLRSEATEWENQRGFQPQGLALRALADRIAALLPSAPA